MFAADDAEALASTLAAKGVLVSALTPKRIRAVTHLDVDSAGIELLLGRVAEALGR